MTSQLNNRRKPLPYVYAANIDDAKMDIDDALGLLLPLVDERVEIETAVRAAKAIDRLHRAQRKLGEIRTEGK